MKSLNTMRITHALSVAAGWLVGASGVDRPHGGNSSELNTLQFTLDDLAAALPNRGVAVVYLAQADD
jgi:hypothetical protein